MRTGINFNGLNGISGKAAQVAALAQAIDVELAMPAIAQAVDKGQASKSVLTLTRSERGGFVPAAQGVKALDRERVKQVIAKRLGLKYATESDNPVLTALDAQFAEFYHSNMADIDNGYLQLFDEVDLRQSTHDHFDIIDTNAGLSWNQRLPGQPVDIRKKITEAKTSVSYLEFADGLGLLDAWLDFQQFWNIDEAIAEFRATCYDKKASLHYGLLTALSSGVNTAFATDDATTFNNAVATILRNMRGTGSAASQNSRFKIACAVEKVGRILAMLEAQQGSMMVQFGTMKQPIAYTVDAVVATTYIPSSDTGYYLVFPGRKLKSGNWKDLTTESARNIYTSATDIVGKIRYNAAIGDSNQVRRVLFS